VLLTCNEGTLIGWTPFLRALKQKPQKNNLLLCNLKSAESFDGKSDDIDFFLKRSNIYAAIAL
jgi:hypothetical protein